MTQNPKSKLEATNAQEQQLLNEFYGLWADADALWERNQAQHAFRSYASADYAAVYLSLSRLQNQVTSVLEWGSGLGIVTIMASRMGFEAYGIEAEPELVEHSRDYARIYGPRARFASGSFIPDEYVWDPAAGDESHKTEIDVASAYDEFDLELRDFDLIYAYPWPDEHTLYHNILKQFGGQHAMLLSYDAREGMGLVHVNDR